MHNFETAFAPAEARAREVVAAQTWGHLFPKKGKHRGFVVFAETGFNNPVLIDAEFEKTDFSPWLYDAVDNLIFEQSEKGLEVGVYVWRGYLYTKKVLVREPEEGEEPEYSEVIKLEGKVTSQRLLKELLK
jgi:hypothetical protein